MAINKTMALPVKLLLIYNIPDLFYIIYTQIILIPNNVKFDIDYR